ncbi:hypothetical protein M378DRAFT_366109 [Amanita muscaria Koide BX008]|uniref:Uncharacterized protein n=1 Tax=Amanita muscaria (strain Koide BX008) TaxID=946122 RepID=A0A0C2WLW7_AMAMK|nr:hypothetical protein M378DRAFT_366109 [Amanita muscaria Koide BX008]
MRSVIFTCLSFPGCRFLPIQSEKSPTAACSPIDHPSFPRSVCLCTAQDWSMKSTQDAMGEPLFCTADVPSLTPDAVVPSREREARKSQTASVIFKTSMTHELSNRSTGAVAGRIPINPSLSSADDGKMFKGDQVTPNNSLFGKNAPHRRRIIISLYVTPFCLVLKLQMSGMSSMSSFQ